MNDVGLTLSLVGFVSVMGAKGSTAGISMPKSDAVVLSAAEIMEALSRIVISKSTFFNPSVV